MTHLDDARGLLLDVAPELGDVPLYLLQHPAHLPQPQETAAYTCVGQHIALRDHLIDLGQWHGPGTMIVFVDAPEDRVQFLGLVLHEVAHALPVVVPTEDTEPTAEQRERQAELVLAWAAADPLDPLVPWAGHDARFIRRLLHLHYRALWAGVVVPLSMLGCAGAVYGLSPASRYLSALGAEPFDMRRCSLAEIEATPAPEVFQDLFATDVARRQTKETKHA